MTVVVDNDGLLGLLHEGDRHSVPFAVRPRRGGDLVQLVEAVQSAIDAANVAAVSRVPDDPSWCTDCTLSGRVVVAELAKGVMTDVEVRAWFDDLASALGETASKVVAHPPDKRIPLFHDWNELPPALTAFVDFLPADPSVWSWRPRPEVRDLSEDLAEWGRIPGATAITMRGLDSFITPPGAAGRELRTSAEVEIQFGLWQITRRPRRARIVHFTTKAKGYLQVIDETATPLDCLPQLLPALRTLAPHLAQARVRRGLTAAPDELDMSYVLQRPATPAEEWATMANWIQLLSDFVVDAYVAQVLTTAHMEKIGTPRGFTVEDLGQDRHLVVASDPAPWLTGLNPDPEVLADARRTFAPAMLTREIADANRRVP